MLEGHDQPATQTTGRSAAQFIVDYGGPAVRPFTAASRPWFAERGLLAPRGMLVEEIDGAPPAHHPMVPFLVEAGFIPGAMGFQATYARR